MAFTGTLNDADIKAALDGCAGELSYLSCVQMTLNSYNFIFTAIICKISLRVQSKRDALN